MTTNNPAEIPLTLDQQLSHEVTLVLYGRAALSLGFPASRPEFQLTMDVDAIISLSQLPELTSDEEFWIAIERTNQLLSPRGLYITHLFCEDQVFLRPGWQDHVVPIHFVPTRFLRLYRPHAVDLILTKMMRGNDSLDMEDIAFLARNDDLSHEQMDRALEHVRIPDILELREAFDRALPMVRQILAKL